MSLQIFQGKNTLNHVNHHIIPAFHERLKHCWATLFASSVCVQWAIWFLIVHPVTLSHACVPSQESWSSVFSCSWVKTFWKAEVLRSTDSWMITVLSTEGQPAGCGDSRSWDCLPVSAGNENCSKATLQICLKGSRCWTARVCSWDPADRSRTRKWAARRISHCCWCHGVLCQACSIHAQVKWHEGTVFLARDDCKMICCSVLRRPSFSLSSNHLLEANWIRIHLTSACVKI